MTLITIILLLWFWQPQPLLILLPPRPQSWLLPPCLACARYAEGVQEWLELIKKWGPRDDTEGFYFLKRGMLSICEDSEYWLVLTANHIPRRLLLHLLVISISYCLFNHYQVGSTHGEFYTLCVLPFIFIPDILRLESHCDRGLFHLDLPMPPLHTAHWYVGQQQKMGLWARLRAKQDKCVISLRSVAFLSCLPIRSTLHFTSWCRLTLSFFSRNFTGTNKFLFESTQWSVPQVVRFWGMTITLTVFLPPTDLYLPTKLDMLTH